MIRKTCFSILGLLVLALLLSGCPKRLVKVPPLEGPPVENPIAKLVAAFSSAETLQSKASIRIDSFQKGEEVNYRLNGVVFYQKPERLRIFGYHPFPLPMDLFDALYQEGEFFLLIPAHGTVYTGEISEFDDLMKSTGVRMSIEKMDGSEVPNRFRIDLVEEKVKIEIRLKDISLNTSLPEDSFKWVTPEGIQIRPLAQLKGKVLQ
jgi:outer membrane lipoprotein-sorting protein